MTESTGRFERLALAVATFLTLSVAISSPSFAQQRIRSSPAFAKYERMQQEIWSAYRPGTISAEWAPDSRSFSYYGPDGKFYRFDVRTRRAVEATPEQAAPALPAFVERGRQYESVLSPDSALKAFYRDRNVWLSRADGTEERQITTDGSAATRTKYGTATWVYGEELHQTTAMWWSPDGAKLAYYRFDESGVPDYYLQLDQANLQSRVGVEAYPKAGVKNPVVDLFVYDLKSGKTTQVDIRDGKPFTDDVIGHYVYRIGWTPDGRELTLNRTNRRQNVMEFVACDPTIGKCCVIVREEWPASWTENSPSRYYLKDQRRFIWTSERTGFRNLYLYDFSGKLLATLTKHPFEVVGIVQVDERAGIVYYLARSGENYMKLQLHRVRLDGKDDRRITDPAFDHFVQLSPDGRYFVDIAGSHTSPPMTQVLDTHGRHLAVLARSDTAGLGKLQVTPVELFSFVSADGQTVLHGMLHKPSAFDPHRRYPMLVDVYGGPATNGAHEGFALPNPFTEFGYLIVTLDLRSAKGRGKHQLDAIYQQLGISEIDDIAAAVRALRARPYVDSTRVGIYGTSYGGYAAVMALLRYPDLFQAACASSPVTDWRNYDTIYSERYMWTPQESKAEYDAGSALTYVDRLRGRLMLYYGTADNNVHPSNTLQLIGALQKAGKSFDVQVGPDQGHSAIDPLRMMEFFVENLGQGDAERAHAQRSVP